MDHFHRAAREAEGHGPHGPLARPVAEIVDLCHDVVHLVLHVRLALGEDRCGLCALSSEAGPACRSAYSCIDES